MFKIFLISILFFCTACFAQENLVDTLIKKDGTRILFASNVEITRNQMQDYCMIDKNKILLNEIKYYTKKDFRYYNCKDKFFVKQKVKGAINIFENNYFQIGDTGKIQKMNYTDLYYAIEKDSEALKILMKGDKKLSNIKKVMLASTLGLANGVLLINASSSGDGSIGNGSLLGILYFVPSAIFASVSSPTFVITGLLGAITGIRQGQKQSILMYNTHH